MALSPRHREFIEHYMKTGNIREAGLLTGYKEGYCKRNLGGILKKKEAQDYMDELSKEMRSDRIADAEEVLAYLTSVMRGEEVEEKCEIVVTEKAGASFERTDTQVQHKDRIKCAQLLGKRYRLFSDNVNMTVEAVTIVDDIEVEDEED